MSKKVNGMGIGKWKPTLKTGILVSTALAISLGIAIEPLVLMGFAVSDWIGRKPLVSLYASYGLLFPLIFGLWIGLVRTSEASHSRAALLSFVSFSFGMGGVYFLVHESGHQCFQFSSNLESAPSILDFCYFSFITVTTVGYGDIVPAHSFVRGLVLFQVLFGLSLIAKLGHTIMEEKRE